MGNIWRVMKYYTIDFLVRYKWICMFALFALLIGVDFAIQGKQHSKEDELVHYDTTVTTNVDDYSELNEVSLESIYELFSKDVNNEYIASKTTDGDNIQVSYYNHDLYIESSARYNCTTISTEIKAEEPVKIIYNEDFDNNASKAYDEIKVFLKSYYNKKMGKVDASDISLIPNEDGTLTIK